MSRGALSDEPSSSVWGPRGCPPAAAVLLLSALIAAPAALRAAQEPPEGGGSGGETPAPGTLPPDAASGPPAESPSDETASGQVPPELQSDFLVRIYKIRPGRLWKGLLEALQAEGLAPEEVDEERRLVKTSFVDFKQDDYDLQVAEAPQPIGGNYHILQLIKVRGGKVSLEATVAPVKTGTELKVRARILVMGLDRVKRVRLLVDRRSTGVIEADFIHKLEARMGLEHL